MKYVHNLGCFAARFMWSYSLVKLTLRTSASGIWIQENMKKKQTTQTRMYTYIYIYIFYLYTYLWKNQTINKCACMHACMDVCMENQ